MSSADFNFDRSNQPTIRNLEDLRRAAQDLKITLVKQEAQLGRRWEVLPEEALKATVTRSIPFLFRTLVKAGTWKLLKEGLGWALSARKKSQD